MVTLYADKKAVKVHLQAYSVLIPIAGILTSRHRVDHLSVPLAGTVPP